MCGTLEGVRMKEGSWATLFRRAARLSNFGGSVHGLRGGGATAALKSGMAQAEVKRLGRWKTNTSFEAYVNVDELPGVPSKKK